jgi:hypothetical protein
MTQPTNVQDAAVDDSEHHALQTTPAAEPSANAMHHGDDHPALGIGRRSATERDAITSEKFPFWLPDHVIVNPFDIVAVDQVGQPGQGGSRTFGLVTALEHRTDAPSHLANYISSNFGELTEEPNTNRQGTTVAMCSVLSNTADIYMPVPSERVVRFADSDDIQQALGTDSLVNERPQDAIPAGLISMSNGASAVAFLDRRFVLGPESAHVNISGISGLATKTSYAMFLIQSILQSGDPSKVAVILLNVKQADLLQVHLPCPPAEQEAQEWQAMWEALGLHPQPFQNVTHLLPRGLGHAARQRHTLGDEPNPPLGTSGICRIAHRCRRESRDRHRGGAWRHSHPYPDLSRPPSAGARVLVAADRVDGSAHLAYLLWIHAAPTTPACCIGVGAAGWSNFARRR